jgi:general secretion pathway protein D
VQKARRLFDRALIAAALAVALIAAPRVARPQPAEPAASPARAGEASPVPPGPRIIESDGERFITMDFQDVDLGVLVKFMGEITGKNFVMDERVQGKVTVISPTKVTPEEAYQVFQAVLQVKGFTTVPSGAAIRIIPTKDAKETSLRTVTDGIGKVPVEEYITRLIPLEQVDTPDVLPVLQPMVSKDGLITQYLQTNSLIIIDSAANVDRLSRLIAELDVPSSRRHTTLIPLKHAAAGDIADTIQQVLDDTRPAAPGQPPPPQAPRAPGSGQLRAFRITPDDRTNTLIVSAAAEQMQQIKALVERLDVPLPPGSGRINVYYLKYANAEDLLPVLLDIIGAPGGARTPTQQQRQQPGQQAGGTSRSQKQHGSSLQRSSMNRQRRPPNQPAQGGQVGQQPAIEFAGDVRITADPATNALIISAGPEDYALLLSVVEKLDIRRRQVYVEAIILEVTLDRMRQLGIETQGGLRLADGTGFSRLSLGNLNNLFSNPAALSGLALGAVSDSTITLPDGKKVPAQVALLTALQNDNDVNILSAPNILTTDNEEAEIIVGQNVPFVASRATSETNLSNVFATIEREDVGITLRLTPQISEGRIVRLALFEEVSAIVPSSVGDPNVVGPTTTVRSASTTIAVKDGQTIVIGGLISDSITASESKIPFISDIPVLGQLFKNTSSSKNKINLLIFLTPHVIKDEVDAETVSISERDRFRALSSGTPRRVPDPLDMQSWQLREDREVPPAGDDGARGASELPTYDRGAAAPAAGAVEARPGAAGTLALADVHVDRRQDGAVIRLDVGAAPVRFEHYALENPGRYVIDVYGASIAAAKVDSLPVIDALVRRVRVARHNGRMRIVLDLVTDKPPAYAVEQQGGTILIKLGAARSAATQPHAAR